MRRPPLTSISSALRASTANTKTCTGMSRAPWLPLPARSLHSGAGFPTCTAPLRRAPRIKNVPGGPWTVATQIPDRGRQGRRQAAGSCKEEPSMGPRICVASRIVGERSGHVNYRIRDTRVLYGGRHPTPPREPSPPVQRHSSRHSASSTTRVESPWQGGHGNGLVRRQEAHLIRR